MSIFSLLKLQINKIVLEKHAENFIISTIANKINVLRGRASVMKLWPAIREKNLRRNKTLAREIRHGRRLVNRAPINESLRVTIRS